ncbi:MAG: 3-hydroxyacyl-CoA dehydrogenase NAD-binding domain-containing protein [Spirochaetaceae bacterium]|nr:3-hydroxyacyl-CoA dehydrogenase NAD-binding domain-containing protein [Spirochaetaceae bacterium]
MVEPRDNSAIRCTHTSDGAVELVFDPPDQRLVVFNSALLSELERVVSALEADIAGGREVRLVLVRSAKPGCFIAGADIGELLALPDADAATRLNVKVHALFGRIAALPVPTVAVIDGACLGGGTECALSCGYRIATDHPKTLIGLPEVTLGIIPGWGGTQRLPRIIGPQAALPMMVSGRALSGPEAAAAGLVDRCVARDGLEAAIADLRADPPARATPPDVMPPVSDSLAGEVEAGIRRGRLHPAAPLAVLRAVRAAAGKPLAHGLALEREAFAECLSSDAGRNLLTLFFSRNVLRRERFGLHDAQPRPVARAAVLGAGVMGGGIAWALSNAGVPVAMKDVAAEPLQRGTEAAAGVYRRLVARGRLAEDEAAARQRMIVPTTSYGAEFAGVDLVVEAVSENAALKARVVAELEEQVGPDTVIATNTSSLPLERLAASLRRPQRFLAMHFFNPVDRMPLVEIAAGPATSRAALAGAVELARRLRKTPVVVRNRPGFLVNRILFPYLMEAARVLEDGGDWQALDRDLAAWGMPMGPFRLIDEIGLDVTLNIARSLAASVDGRMAPPPFLHRLVERGAAGRKGGAGTGFYRYTGREAVPDDDSVAAAVAEASATRMAAAGHAGEPPANTGQTPGATATGRGATGFRGMAGPPDGAGRTAHTAGAATSGSRRAAEPPDGGDRVARCLAMLVNEAARCMTERIVDRPLYLDLALLLGIGFPDHRGGVLRYADQSGLGRLVDRMEELRERYGERFRPCTELSERAAAGTMFYGPGQ